MTNLSPDKRPKHATLAATAVVAGTVLASVLTTAHATSDPNRKPTHTDTTRGIEVLDNPNYPKPMKHFYAGAQIGPALADDHEVSSPDSDSYGENDISMDTGLSFNGVFGYYLNPYIRIEGEISYTGADASNRDVDATQLAGMFNIYAEKPFALWGATPYIGAGLGLSRNSLDSGKVDDSDTTTAYQFRLGAFYEIREWISVDLGVRHFITSSTSYKHDQLGEVKGDWKHTDILGAVRYHF